LEEELARKKVPHRWLIEQLETSEERKERKRQESAKRARRRRRELAKVGLTPEEFEKGCKDFLQRFGTGGVLVRAWVLIRASAFFVPLA
jgi:hypothetical protein